MRPIWKGSISFGLVVIPVSVYPATEEKSVRFHLLHQSDGSRIEYHRVCAEEQIEVENDDIVRAYEYGRDRYVVVEDQDLEWHDGRMTAKFVDQPDLKAARFNISRTDGRLAVLNFHFMIAAADGIEEFTEVHHLALFTRHEFEQAFRAAAFDVTFDIEGPHGARFVHRRRV